MHPARLSILRDQIVAYFFHVRISTVDVVALVLETFANDFRDWIRWGECAYKVTHRIRSGVMHTEESSCNKNLGF
jgi:hypothetical protein